MKQSQLDGLLMDRQIFRAQFRQHVRNYWRGFRSELLHNTCNHFRILNFRSLWRILLRYEVYGLKRVRRILSWFTLEVDTNFLLLLVNSYSMGVAGGSRFKRVRTAKTLELLVLVAREDFLAVNVMHFDMLVPTLARKNWRALVMRTAIVVLVDKVVPLVDRWRIYAKRNLFLVDIFVLVLYQPLHQYGVAYRFGSRLHGYIIGENTLHLIN